jgi:hypothetical protein
METKEYQHEDLEATEERLDKKCKEWEYDFTESTDE